MKTITGKQTCWSPCSWGLEVGLSFLMNVWFSIRTYIFKQNLSGKTEAQSKEISGNWGWRKENILKKKVRTVHIPQPLSSRYEKACSEDKFLKKATCMLNTDTQTHWTFIIVNQLCYRLCYRLKSQMSMATFAYLKWHLSLIHLPDLAGLCILGKCYLIY